MLLVVMLVSGCQWMVKRQLDQDHGESVVVQRFSPVADRELYQAVETIIEQRCVVCHACYDAPCQLKLDSIEGLDRGATMNKVYDKYRMRETPLTRLFEDATTTQQWREKNFYPVLNERQQTPEANLELSVLYQLLELKNKNPLPNTEILGKEFDFSLTKEHICPKIENFNAFSKNHALWGMPYGLPAISEQEFSTIEQWLANGSKVPERESLSKTLIDNVDKWEVFLNGSSNKAQLVSRYIYEHLFLAHFYFDAIDEHQFFKMVRSSTPPGQPIKIISTRRAYDNPGVSRVYYRLETVREAIIAKTHMPYALNQKRLQLWEDLFFNVEYEVSKLPDYSVKTSSNPFIAFTSLPMRSRYKFLLDEAQFAIMSFIKGPVCRGQIALDVINDHFWVAFVNPDLASQEKEEEFIETHTDLLRFPAYWESNGSPLAWMDLAARQKEFVDKKAQFMDNIIDENFVINLDLVWDGNGTNDNAALTVFRHIDSATVVKGFVGEQPKTAWLINYPLLERIYYLLVTGFDVHGSLVHQLTTRLYMDFLRMEGEANFIALLPKKDRAAVQQSWYIEAEATTTQYFASLLTTFTKDSAIVFNTDDSKTELLDMLIAHTHAKRYFIDTVLYDAKQTNSITGEYAATVKQLASLNKMVGINISYLPPSAILEVVGNEQSYYFSLVHNNAHKNITYIFRENMARLPEKDDLTITAGILAAYPSAFYKISTAQIPAFIQAIETLASEQDYYQLMSSYGIRRTNKEFWSYSDRLHDYYKKTAGVEYGLLDYNRLENR